MASRRFVDKVVWITGASSGLGHALALEMARQGAHLAVTARRVDRLAALVQDIEAKGQRALAVPCDVTDETAMQASVARIVDHFGRLDVAVANAGFGVTGRIERLDAAAWRRQLETNVVGTVITARCALSYLRKTRGRLVLVASVAGFLTGPRFGPYSASKYAVRAIGQTLAIELAGTGVSCTTLAPGFVESEIGRVDNDGRYDPARPDTRPHALLWPTDKAARVMARAIARRKREYVFTWHGKVGAFVGKHFPSAVYWASVLTRRARR